MHKKLIAVAVAGAFAAPGVALAQASTVEIGGSLTVLYYQHKPHNANVAKKGDIFEQSEPELFVRGEEKLGGGLSAWFRCASSLDAISEGGEGAGFCTRNSAVGLKGSFGNLFAGNWDMPQKLVVNRIRGAFSGTNALWGGSARLLFGGSASGVRNPVQSVVASPSIGGVTGAATVQSFNAVNFFRRQAQSWSYHSPVWNGFQVQGAFSTANETTGIPEATALKPRLYSLAAHYSAGPVYVGVGYERHKDYNPANTTVGVAASAYNGGEDENWTFGAGYTFAGVFKLTGMYSRSEYDMTNTSTLKTRGWAIFGDWKLGGPHTVRAGYAEADDTKGNAGMSAGVFVAPTTVGGRGAKWFNTHYEYAFSKRTAGLISYNRISNDSVARFSLGKTNPTLGGSQTAIGIGFKHRF